MSTPPVPPSPKNLPTNPIPCPRCGYDQRGPVATWHTSCPLAGKCTECGLDFLWCDLLNPNLIRPKWCVEYAEKWWNIPGKSLRTLLKMMWPWGFWRDLKMALPLKWRMLSAYLGLLLFVIYATFCLFHGVSVYQFWRFLALSPFSTFVFDWRDIAQAVLLPFSTSGWFSSNMPAWPPGYTPGELLFSGFGNVLIGPIIFICCIHALTALGFLCLPVSRRSAKVRWSHVFRIALYGMSYSASVSLILLLLGVVILLPPAGAYTEYIAITGYAILVLGMIPVSVIWWATAVGRYLKMKHAWAIGILLVIMAILLLIFFGALLGAITNWF